MSRCKPTRIKFLFNFVIFLLSGVNFILWFAEFPKKNFDDVSQNNFAEDYPNITRSNGVSMRIAPLDPEISKEIYTPAELEDAIQNLNLPTWSRSYVLCTSPQSEVTCPQIVHAWRTIKRWIDAIQNQNLEERKYVVTRHYFDGVGNRISIDTVVALLGIMSNRTMVVEGSFLKDGQVIQTGGNAYDYHHSIFRMNETLHTVLNETDRNTPYYVPTFDGWFHIDFYDIFQHDKTIDLSVLMYSTQLYTHPQLSEFAQKHFGMHAVYFLSNFLVHIPEKHLNNAKNVVNSVPKTTRIFGVHLRIQFPGQFYSYSPATTMDVVEPFLRQKLAEMPTVLAFASDHDQMTELFTKRFGHNFIQTNATRKADFDHTSALTDVALLMMADEDLLSYRSTFSFAVSSRMGKRCWFVEKEAPMVFQASNSQSTAVSMLMHHWDVNDWQTCRRFRQLDNGEPYMRYYFKYFML